MIKRDLWIKAKICKNNGKIYCSMFWCHHEEPLWWIKKYFKANINRLELAESYILNRWQNTDLMTVFRGKKNLNSSFSLGQIALKFYFPWVCLVCSLNDLVDRCMTCLIPRTSSKWEWKVTCWEGKSTCPG